MEKSKEIRNEQEETNNECKSEMQDKIDKELNSDALKDMHLESGEKINDYPV